MTTKAPTEDNVTAAAIGMVLGVVE